MMFLQFPSTVLWLRLRSRLEQDSYLWSKILTCAIREVCGPGLRGGTLKLIKQVYNPTKTVPISEFRSGLVTLFATWRNQFVQYVSKTNAKLRDSFKFSNSVSFFYCRIQFSTCSPWSQCWEDFHYFQRVMSEQSLFESQQRPRYTPTPNSGEARRAALVPRFSAGRALAVRRSRLLNMLQPSASKRLPRGAQ